MSRDSNRSGDRRRLPGPPRVLSDLEQAVAPPRALHVIVPHEAWRRARTAALDSGLAFKDYMALLMLSARPIRSQGDGQAAAAVDADGHGPAGSSHEDGPRP
ncbi:hypothetical protein [Paludisphaera sp.]|uniref:hypothetical protein n=1 Tax=Paludisphaera sp. TaxID=2017432 RepID=UPI00301D6EE5